MQRVSSIFSQILQLQPRAEFEKAVAAHKAEYASKGFDSWTQFICLLFCQLAGAYSLREICGGLAGCEGKLRHLGVFEFPKRSTLAYANAHRPWEVYKTVFEQLLAKCHAVVSGREGVRKKFKFKNKLVSLDSSTIDLCLTMYDWAKFRQAKGAVKLHLLLDHDGYLPSFAVITDGKQSDIKVARSLQFDRGTVLVMDRGYIDYKWFVKLTHSGVYFVTRMKSNAVFDVVEEHSVEPGSEILSDKTITLKNTRIPLCEKFRIVEVMDESKQRSISFLTNNMDFDAKTIAAIYKDRWNIELFFKAIKQNLKIKTFLGTSPNAVKTQIWTALIVMLILRYLKMLSSFNWSLSNLVSLLRFQLFVYRDLHSWLNVPFEGPPQLDESGPLQLSFSFSS